MPAAAVRGHVLRQGVPCTALFVRAVCGRMVTTAALEVWGVGGACGVSAAGPGPCSAATWGRTMGGLGDCRWDGACRWDRVPHIPRRSSKWRGAREAREGPCAEAPGHRPRVKWGVCMATTPGPARSDVDSAATVLVACSSDPEPAMHGGMWCSGPL